MASEELIEGLPIITDSTRAQSENVETIVARLRNERLIIPEYQRDAEQWDTRKESLFIESILNNLTVPAFFFSPREDRTIDIVDGQQRLLTILKYARDDFSLSDDESMVYITPQSVHYRGKKFSQLPPLLQATFNDYPLTIIYLPHKLDLSTKLEIFRRINEGGSPLTAQDIRLSYYSESKSVTFIRLAGFHRPGVSIERMLKSAANRGIQNPWDNSKSAYRLWEEWWKDKRKSRGQIPSEMFLWYLVTRNREALNDLLATPNQIKHLPISFRGSTEEALDLYCAQLRWTESDGCQHQAVGLRVEIFPTGKSLQQEFDDFALWMKTILSQGLTGISVDKYKQLSLMIAALVEQRVVARDISHNAWDALSEFIRTPREAGRKWLEAGYPEQKGRWGGKNGQYSQCERACELVQKILEKYSLGNDE